MSRIDRSAGQGATMERRHIQQMLRHMVEYELVKQKGHKTYKTATAFYQAKGLCRQNFLKFYRRYLLANREINALIPRKAGRKFKDTLQYAPEILDQVKQLREKGYNRYDIALHLRSKLQNSVALSPSSVYRLMKKLGVHQLNPKIKTMKKKIVKDRAGELGHIDIHYLPKGIVKETGNQKLYLLGLIDDYSRICWLEVVTTIKAIPVMFSALDIILRFGSMYNITFDAIMSDNGKEFASRNNPDHPFESLLRFYGIKHRYTKPFRPQTNGKIERFWKTLDTELLDGEQFDTLAELKEYVAGYCIYYNQHRTHQGINHKTPTQMLTDGEASNSNK